MSNKNVLSLVELSATNNDMSPKYIPAYTVHQLDSVSDSYKVRLHLTNLINTFGIDLVTATVKTELELQNKPKRKQKVS